MIEVRVTEMQSGQSCVPTLSSLWGQKIFKCQNRISKFQAYSVPLTLQTPAFPKKYSIAWANTMPISRWYLNDVMH